MTQTIMHAFHFEAAHQLLNVPPEHKCRQIHGHSYRVELYVTGKVVNGFVRDFADLERAWAGIHNDLDHKFLNNVIDCPTAENIAKYIGIRLQALVSKVIVWETRDCCASWEQ